MKLLILRLEGPLQSWGERSKWDNRDSALMPTKSGVLGIIACCMGIPRDDSRMLELHEKLRIAVRADMPGRLGVDFNTVKSNTLMNAEGKTQDRTIVSYRQYLQDASFIVVIASADDGLLSCIADAMKRPKWAAFLGRKSCVPTYPLIPVETDEFDSMEDAVNACPFAERVDPEMRSFRVEIEDSTGRFTRGDRLTATGRHFSGRRVIYSVARSKQDVSL